MKRYIRAGVGTGHRVEYYIGQGANRDFIHIDGFQCRGFSTKEECQQAIDEIYNDNEYYRERYPNLRVHSRDAYDVWHE